MGKRINADVLCEDITAISNEEWLELRKGTPTAPRIGGSDAPAVMGKSTFKTKFKLWAEKAGISEPEPVSLSTQLMFDIGHDMEPHILNMFQVLMGEKYRIYTDRRQYVHKQYPFMIGDADGLMDVDDRTIGLEIKTYTDSPQLRANWKSGELGQTGSLGHPFYEWQVRHYMAVLDLDEFYFLAFPRGSINPEDLTVVHVTRDAEKEAKLIETEKEFVEMIKNKIAPPIENVLETTISYGQPGTADEVTHVINAELEPVLSRARDIVNMKSDLNRQIKELDAEYDELKERITLDLGDCTKGVLECTDGTYSVSNKKAERKACDYVKLQTIYPEAYAECVNEKKEDANPTFRLSFKQN